jgi:hypothetical protein
MKKQDIEKLVSELRSCVIHEEMATVYAKTPIQVARAEVNMNKFKDAADALERILKEGIE